MLVVVCLKVILGLFICFAQDHGRESLYQMSRHFTKSSRGCRRPAPLCLTLLHPCKQFKNHHQLWIHSIWWGCDYCSWCCSGPDSLSCSQLCQMVSLVQSRADEMRQERHLGQSQERNESGRDLNLLFPHRHILGAWLTDFFYQLLADSDWWLIDWSFPVTLCSWIRFLDALLLPTIVDLKVVWIIGS